MQQVRALHDVSLKALQSLKIYLQKQINHPVVVVVAVVDELF